MKRIVIKTGSQVLCDDSGALSETTLASLAAQISALREDDWEVLLVSSGAVAAGSGPAKDRLQRSDPVTRRQVLAAMGQVRLMRTWQQLFAEHDLEVAQVLASKSDFQSRDHYLNMRNCLEGILAAGVVPIVNENDVVSITELMFTDNDELAGLLAGMVSADLLCLLSTVEGVYAGAEEHGVISLWDDEQHTINEVVGSGTSRMGRGGMHSKLSVARKTASLGTEVVITDGREADILLRIVAGESAGTRFAAGTAASPAKRWLATAGGHAAGSVRVNAGAAEALRDQNRLTSLLPVGIVGLEGQFQKGDVILILDAEGHVMGCGRSQFDRAEADSFIGQRAQKPLIHYDYLYLID